MCGFANSFRQKFDTCLLVLMKVHEWVRSHQHRRLHSRAISGCGDL